MSQDYFLRHLHHGTRSPLVIFYFVLKVPRTFSSRAWRRQTPEPHLRCPPAHRRDTGAVGRPGSPRAGAGTARPLVGASGILCLEEMPRENLKLPQ
jgi:hypothetical protein